jgi:hypothetical protein
MRKDHQENPVAVNMFLVLSIKIAPTIADLPMATIAMSEEISNKSHIDHKIIIAQTIMAVIVKIVIFSLDMVALRKVDQVDIDKTIDLVVNMVIVPNMAVQAL